MFVAAEETGLAAYALGLRDVHAAVGAFQHAFGQGLFRHRTRTPLAAFERTARPPANDEDKDQEYE